MDGLLSVRIDESTGLPLEIEDGRPQLQCRVCSRGAGSVWWLLAHKFLQTLLAGSHEGARQGALESLTLALHAATCPQSLANALKLCKKKLERLAQERVHTKEDLEHYQVRLLV